MTQIRSLLFLLLAPAVISGCATGGEAAPMAEAAAGVTVEVENTVVPPTSLVVYMVPSTGTRQMLGTVDPNSSQTFRFSAAATPERYRLVGETTAGTDLVSREFTVTGDITGLTWDVELNTVNLY